MFLKQSTAAQSVAIGPFVDETDFKTAETALTINNTDIKIVMNGGASANKNSGGGTHRVNGVYGITLDATDTATIGEMEISVVVAGALPVFHKFYVLEEAVYDALFAASAPGYVSNAPVNVAQISGDAVAADNAEAFFDGTGYSGTNNVIPTVTAVTNGVSLADDAITSAKFDESTAFPLKAADVGATLVARSGADADTLKTLSDQVDTAQTDLNTLTGADGVTLATLQPNYAPAVAGDAMTLANDAVSAAALAADALAEIKAEVEAVLASTSRAELATVPAANASLADKLTWITMILRNKRTQTNTTETVYADDGSTPVATSTKSDDGTTYTRSEYV